MQSLGRLSGRRRSIALLAVAGVTVGLVSGLAGDSGVASSHREAPLVAADPQIDNTDTYAFVSPDKPDTVTLIANWIPFEEPNGGPNFYPFATDAKYDINVDSDGNGKPDVTYRWTFRTQDRRGKDTFLYNNGPVTSLDDANLLFRQSYTLTEIRKGHSRTLLRNAPVAPSDTGRASMPNYGTLRQQAITGGNGVTSYAGQADDPFFLDLRVFDLLYGTNLGETKQDTLNGYNVNTVALQVPKSALALRGDAARNPVVGIWSATSRKSMTVRSAGKVKSKGKDVQVSRLGNPLVNEVVAPAGLKDAFNALSPDKDHTVPALVDRVTNPEVPRLIESIYGIKAPVTPRRDLTEIFLTGIAKSTGGPIQADLNSQLLNADVDPKKFTPAEELRLNMAVAPAAHPNRLGVLGNDLQGFPNGRRLTDDVVDIEVQALEGATVSGLVKALAAGDGVNANEVPFGSAFPYLALPHDSAVNGGRK